MLHATSTIGIMAQSDTFSGVASGMEGRQCSMVMYLEAALGVDYWSIAEE